MPSITARRLIHDQVAFELGYLRLADIANVTYDRALADAQEAQDWGETTAALRVAMTLAQALDHATSLNTDREMAQVLAWNLIQLPHPYRLSTKETTP